MEHGHNTTAVAGAPSKAGPLTPRTQFFLLMTELDTAYRRDNAVCDQHADALNEIREHLVFVDLNEADGDTDLAKLENLAHAAGAIMRYAEVLLSRIAPAAVADMIDGLSEEETLTEAAQR